MSTTPTRVLARLKTCRARIDALVADESVDALTRSYMEKTLVGLEQAIERAYEVKREIL